MELERIALKDDYFIEKKLYPNVDFYSGIILKAMGFPTSMFTVLFASPTVELGRPMERDDETPIRKSDGRASSIPGQPSATTSRLRSVADPRPERGAPAGVPDGFRSGQAALWRRRGRPTTIFSPG